MDLSGHRGVSLTPNGQIRSVSAVSQNRNTPGILASGSAVALTTPPNVSMRSASAVPNSAPLSRGNAFDLSGVVINNPNQFMKLGNGKKTPVCIDFVFFLLII
jgi:hypothetical protein